MREYRYVVPIQLKKEKKEKQTVIPAWHTEAY